MEAREWIRVESNRSGGEGGSVSSRMEAGARVDPCRVGESNGSGGASGSVAEETRWLGWVAVEAVGEEETETGRRGWGRGRRALVLDARARGSGARGRLMLGGRHVMSSCHIVMPYIVMPGSATSLCHGVMPHRHAMCAHLGPWDARRHRNADSSSGACVSIRSGGRMGRNAMGWGRDHQWRAERFVRVGMQREKRGIIDLNHRERPRETPHDETRRTTAEARQSKKGAGRGARCWQRRGRRCVCAIRMRREGWDGDTVTRRCVLPRETREASST
jgi:hypothetical protein